MKNTTVILDGIIRFDKSFARYVDLEQGSAYFLSKPSSSEAAD